MVGIKLVFGKNKPNYGRTKSVIMVATTSLW